MAWIGGVPGTAGVRQEGAGADVPTFAADVAPILYRHCAGCHRPGEAAPMSLLTYEDSRPWARAIRNQVLDGSMPPWHADAPPGTFQNERRLTDAEKDVIVRWANGGAPLGNGAALPPPPDFPEGWTIGTPDAVFQMAEAFEVPADGWLEYKYFEIPTNFTEAKWVQAIEVRPGSRELVHHVLVFYREPEGPAARQPALRVDPEKHRQPPPVRPDGSPAERPRRIGPLVASYAPGTNPLVLLPGTAMRLAAGGELILQMHYTPAGAAGSDRTSVGMIFAREPVTDEIRASHFFNTTLVIPAGAADHRVDAEVTFVEDVLLWGIFPHTHLRGKRWEYRLVAPDGTSRPVLSVPNYDFNWQTYYFFAEPLRIAKGSRLESSAWYDNSRKNLDNPDPTVDVRWGDQAWEEMQYTGITFSVAK